MKRTITTALTCLIGATLLSSCLMPGKYRLYRVANSKTESSPSCYGGMIPPSIAQDTDSFKTGSTFAIFAADSDVFYLDVADQTVQGEKKKLGEYEFAGTSVDVEPSGDPNVQATTTTTTKLTIKLEKSGRKVSGKSTLDVNVVCVGGDCPMGINSQCTQNTSFEGAEMQDVDLEHSV